MSVELKRYSGSTFSEYFKELALDNIDSKINPVADVYIDLIKEEGKYKDGEKLFDEKDNGTGGMKEIGKEEVIFDEKELAKTL